MKSLSCWWSLINLERFQIQPSFISWILKKIIGSSSRLVTNVQAYNYTKQWHCCTYIQGIQKFRYFALQVHYNIGTVQWQVHYSEVHTLQYCNGLRQYRYSTVQEDYSRGHVCFSYLAWRLVRLTSCLKSSCRCCCWWKLPSISLSRRWILI